MSLNWKQSPQASVPSGVPQVPVCCPLLLICINDSMMDIIYVISITSEAAREPGVDSISCQGHAKRRISGDRTLISLAVKSVGILIISLITR